MTKRSDKAKFSALTGCIDCKMSILNSKVDLFKESLKETITNIGKCENNNMEILQENISFVQEEVFLAKNNIIKSMMETQTVALKAITNRKEKPQDQHELPNITYQQQIQQEHQGHQQNQQKHTKIPSLLTFEKFYNNNQFRTHQM